MGLIVSLALFGAAKPKILAASTSLSSVRDAAYVLDQAYGERLHDEIYRRVLRKRGFDIASFRKEGKEKMHALSVPRSVQSD